MKIAKAGEGLPEFERLFIRWGVVPLVCTFLSWEKALSLLEEEVLKIEELIKDIPKQSLTKQIKIARVFGIESHSSDYSVNMVLEHLYITGQAVMKLVFILSQETDFDKEVSIEGVKPTGNLRDVDKLFLEDMNKYSCYIKKHKKNISQKRVKHPWFREFNNKEWASFVYIHTFVHRRQLEAIIKKL